MKTTCLHDDHVKQGALMAEFAGFDMPISYRGIEEEHKAVRERCGVFDVSHMGEIFVEGPDAEAFVNHVFTNDVSSLPIGGVAYGMFTRPDGGVVDDLLVYKLDAEYFLLVVNASNIDKDREWLMSVLNADGADWECEVQDESDLYGELALQGPLAEKAMKEIMGVDLKDLPFFNFRYLKGTESILVSRTGYTGEDGFEIYARPEVIKTLWRKMMDRGVEPCGLGCRDTLRFEVGLPLYGHELDDSFSPIEGSLGMFVKLDKPDGFLGSDVLKAQKEQGVKKKIVGLRLEDRAIARAGYPVMNEQGETIGHVTTGYRSLSVEGAPSLAMALIDARYAKKDTKVLVQVRRKTFPATVVPRRFYKKSYKN